MKASLSDVIGVPQVPVGIYAAEGRWNAVEHQNTIIAPYRKHDWSDSLMILRPMGAE